MTRHTAAAPDADSTRGRASDSTVVVALIIAVCFAMALVAGLLALGRDPAQVVYLIAPTLGIAMTQVLQTYRLSRLSNQVEQVSAHTEQIERNTNGHMTRLANAAGLPPATPEADTPQQQ